MTVRTITDSSLDALSSTPTDRNIDWSYPRHRSSSMGNTDKLFKLEEAGIYSTKHQLGIENTLQRTILLFPTIMFAIE